MAELGLTEVWVMLGDITNSTEFFYRLTELGEVNPAKFHHASAFFVGQIGGLFSLVEQTIVPAPGAVLGNTMGDGFLVVGNYGHGSQHITNEAKLVMQMATKIKKGGDELLAKLKFDVETILKISVPDLRLKIAVNQGFMVIDLKEKRYVGDTINYCSRVSSSAFKGSTEGIVMTDRFFDVLPQDLKVLMSPFKKDVKLDHYPSKHDEARPFSVYRFPLEAMDKVE